MSTNTGSALRRKPDIEAARAAARRRFLKRFRQRLNDRRERSAHRRANAGTKLQNQRPRGRRRKRTAVALGVSALGLSGASNAALSAGAQDTIHQSIEIFDPTERRYAGELSVSDDLLEAMVEEEGVRYDVYRDVAGYPTVGVGHLVLPEDGLRTGDTISHERAMDLLEQDLKKAERGVQKLVGELPINQNEFDALVDLVFNVGEGTVSERKSPRLNEAIQNGDYQGIADELDYTTAKNRVAKGLIHRSERRTQIFMNADYSDPREATQTA
ncbi:MAG: lysozyme [Erythrobacter sp.]